MNITYVLGSFPKLSETFVLDQMTYLIDQGHNLNIIASNDPLESLEHADVKNYDLKNKTTYLSQSLFHSGFELGGEALEKLLFTDIIHAHFAAKPARIAMEIAGFADIPFIFTAHAHDIFIDPDLRQLIALVESAKKVLTISQFNKEYLTKLVGQRHRHKIEIVRCSVDLDRVQPKRGEINERPIILTCGRLVEKKGMQFVIRALAQMPKDLNAELRVIGDGPLRAELEQLVTKMGLSDQVRFLGAQTHESVFSQLQSADIFVLTSVRAVNGDREGIPVSILEAQAACIPVISTLHSGIPEGVQDGRTGFLVPERDVDAIASKLELLLRDAQMRADMGANGRSFISNNFNSLTELPKVERIMQVIVDERELNSAEITTQQQRLLGQRLSLIVSSQTTPLKNEIARLKEELTKETLELKRRLAQVENKDRHIQYLHKELQAMRRRITWRITAPLRTLMRVMKTVPVLDSRDVGEKSNRRLAIDPQVRKTEIKKVLYVLDVFPKLSETFVLNEIIELMERGIQVRIVALRNPFEATINQKIFTHGLLGNTKWVGAGSSKIFLNPTAIRVNYGDVDIIHSHFAAKAAEVGARIARILDLPVTIVAHAHELFQSPKIHKVRRLMSKVAAIITPSEYNRSYIYHTIGHQEANVHVIHATINAEEFVAANNHEGGRVGKRIISIGRLVEKKGFEYLIAAMPKILAKHPDTLLHLVGSGLLKDALTRQAKELGIFANVCFEGDRPNEDCAFLLSQSDVAVLPCIIADDGDRDVCPLTLQESMAMGLPVVSTSVASIPELVDDQVSGILVPGRDAESLAVAIIKLIDNRELARQMGLKGREKIEKEFNIKTQVDCLLGVWNSLLSSTKPE